MEIRNIIVSEFNKDDQIEILHRVCIYMIENDYTATYHKYKYMYNLSIFEYGNLKLNIEYDEKNRVFNIYNVSFEEGILNTIEDIINRDVDLEG